VLVGSRWSVNKCRFWDGHRRNCPMTEVLILVPYANGQRSFSVFSAFCPCFAPYHVLSIHTSVIKVLKHAQPSFLFYHQTSETSDDIVKS
jgi:hypothetical protein